MSARGGATRGVASRRVAYEDPRREDYWSQTWTRCREEQEERAREADGPRGPRRHAREGGCHVAGGGRATAADVDSSRLGYGNAKWRGGEARAVARSTATALLSASVRCHPAGQLRFFPFFSSSTGANGSVLFGTYPVPRWRVWFVYFSSGWCWTEARA